MLPWKDIHRDTAIGLDMHLLEMGTTGGDTAAKDSIITSIMQALPHAPENTSLTEFEAAVRSSLEQAGNQELTAVQERLKDYAPEALRAFGHVLYSYTHSANAHPLKLSADLAIPFYAETTPTAVAFLRAGSYDAVYSVLTSTLTNEYALLLRSVDPKTAMTLGRAAVMCRSINGGLPLAVGGVFNKKFVSPYSGDITFDELGWLGRQESKLVAHAEYLREHKTYERRFIEKLLSSSPSAP